MWFDSACYVLRMAREREHGALRYRHDGCRCDVCRAGNAARVAKRLATRFPQRIEVDGRLVAPVPQEQHGQRGTYTNHGCRCEACTSAARQARWPDTPDRVTLTAPERAQLRSAQTTLAQSKKAGPGRAAAMAQAKKVRDALVLELDGRHGHGYGLGKQLAEALGLSRYMVDRILRAK